MTDTKQKQHDPLDALTVAEIDAGSRLLRADLVGAITQGTAQRWPALAIMAYLHARRTDHGAQLATYRAMTAAELSAELEGLGGGSAGEEVELEADNADGVVEAIPELDLTGAEPLAEVDAPPAEEEVVEEVVKRPTARRRG